MMNFILKFRIPIILVSSLITILFITGFILNTAFGINIIKLEKNAGFESLVPENNKDYKYFKEIEKIFGNMDTITIGISSNDTVFNKDTLNAINEFSAFLENREEIDDDDVLSLTTVDNMNADYGMLEIDPLIETEYINDLNEYDFDDIKEQVKNNPLFNNRLVSEDNKTTIIIANVPTEITLDEKKYSGLIADTYKKAEILRNKYKNTKIYVSGYATAKANIADYMQRDLRSLFIFALITVMIILYIILREIRGMLIPVSVTVFSIIWTFGLKGLFRVPITVTEIVIPVMLIAIGCADGVHIISEFYHFLKQGLKPKEALFKTMKILTVPVILTSITTAFGFFSLIMAPGVSIKNMGIFLAFGVMIAMFFSLFFIPAVLSFYKKTRYKNKKSEKEKKFYFADKLFNKMGDSVPKYKYIIVLTAIIFIIVSIIGIINIRPESDPVAYFQKNDKFRKATEFINKEMGGISDLYIIFENKNKDYMKEPHVLNQMWEMQKYIETLDGVSFTVSIADYIRYLNYLMNDNDENYNRLPKEKEIIQREKYEIIEGKEVILTEEEEVAGKNQVANLILFYEQGGGDTLDTLINYDYTKACVHVRLRNTGTQKLKKIMKDIKPYIAKNIDKGVSIHYSNHYLRMVTSDIITMSQLYSLITTLIAVAILLSIIFRSIQIGIITIVPTFIAVIMNFAIMWIFKIPLDIGTSTIAAIGIGVGIDYAIHYFQRFKLIYQETNDYNIAVKESIKKSARAILSNALSVGLGFAVLMLSRFNVIFNLGWIVSISMFTTAISALTVLPALILILKPKINFSSNILKNLNKEVLETN